MWLYYRDLKSIPNCTLSQYFYYMNAKVQDLDKPEASDVLAIFILRNVRISILSNEGYSSEIDVEHYTNHNSRLYSFIECILSNENLIIISFF